MLSDILCFSQHVLKDKGVLALIKKKAAEQEGRASDQQWDMEEIVTYVSGWSIVWFDGSKF